jgi:serine/threonine protein kinase
MDESLMRDDAALDVTTGTDAPGERDSGVRERLRARYSDGAAVIGHRYGPYEVLEILGSGAMGHIYRARHVLLDRRVAIKVLRPELIDDEIHLERFIAEARAVNLLHHPHVIDVMDIGLAHDPPRTPWFVMELLEGADLAKLLTQQELGVLRALHIMRQVCDALDAIHAAGVVHRDIKPENIFVTQRDGRDFVKLIDFGVARLRDPQRAAANGQRKDNLIGTPHYMAPEQIGDHPIDHRADLYAVGAVLFELISGAPPLDGDDLVELLRRVMVTRAPLLSSCAAVPGAVRADLDRLLADCLEKRPADRPGSARAVIERMDDIAARLTAPNPFMRDLPTTTLDEAFVPHVPRRSLGMSFVVGAALAVAALVAGARLAFDESGPRQLVVQASAVPAPAAPAIERVVEPRVAAPADEAALAEDTLAAHAPVVEEPPAQEEVVLVGVEMPTDLDTADERRERRRARRRARAELAEAEPILSVTPTPEPAVGAPATPFDRDGVLNPFR